MPKVIRIERQNKTAQSGWKTIPNGDRVTIWANSTAEATDPITGRPGIRHLFHIPHMEGINRGNRVTYFGEQFRVVEVSESSQLRGLELLCEPFA